MCSIIRYICITAIERGVEKEMSNKKKDLHLTIPEEVFEMLTEYAESTHRTKSQAVIDLIIEKNMSLKKENS